jgi:hypothetical protein
MVPPPLTMDGTTAGMVHAGGHGHDVRATGTQMLIGPAQPTVVRIEPERLTSSEVAAGSVVHRPAHGDADGQSGEDTTGGVHVVMVASPLTTLHVPRAGGDTLFALMVMEEAPQSS